MITLTNANASGVEGGVTWSGSVSGGFLSLTSSVAATGMCHTESSVNNGLSSGWLLGSGPTARIVLRYPILTATTSLGSNMAVAANTYGKGTAFYNIGSQTFELRLFTFNTSWYAMITNIIAGSNTQFISNAAGNTVNLGAAVATFSNADPALLNFSTGSMSSQIVHSHIATTVGTFTNLAVNGTGFSNGQLLRQHTISTTALRLGLVGPSYDNWAQGQFVVASGSLWRVNMLTSGARYWALFQTV